MGKTKITVRIEQDVYEAAKRFAEDHDTTITNLVTVFFRSLKKGKTKAASQTPVLDELTGILSPDTRIEDYYDHLERKYISDQ